MPSKNLKQVNVALPIELYEALVAATEQEGLSKSKIIRRAIANELGIEEPTIKWGKVKKSSEGHD